MAIVAYLSGVFDFTIRAFASAPWHLYLGIYIHLSQEDIIVFYCFKYTCNIGSSISFLKSVSSPMCRSILAQIVPSEDIGKKPVEPNDISKYTINICLQVNYLRLLPRSSRFLHSDRRHCMAWSMKVRLPTIQAHST